MHAPPLPFRWTLILLVVLPLVACDGATSINKVPPELIGVWRTNSGRHAASYLDIREREFVLGIKHLTLDQLSIESIDVKTTPKGQNIYRLNYTAAEGYPETLVLRVRADMNEIQVGEIPTPWHRSDQL